MSSDYFATIGARLARGRFFTEADDSSKPRVAVINETLARMYFPDEDPIGKQIGDIGLSPTSIREIVGVVGDIREGALDSEMWPAVYVPLNQRPRSDYSSVVGLYGVVAYSVGQRTREIGVRMALGAQRRNVYGLVSREAGWLGGIGIGAGLICSLALAKIMRELLFGIQPGDAPTHVAVICVLAFSALLAAYVPARRAASVNPVEALRAE